MKGNQFKQENLCKSDFLFSETSKKSLRAFYRHKLSEMSLSRKKQKVKKINQLILNLPVWRQARFIAVYKAFKQEPCLSSFCSVWKNKICFPVIDGDQLSFYTNKENFWQKNKFNIREPVSKEKNRVALKDISVFFLPGLAFDRKGGRLGRGQAYYDKTLSSIKRDPKPNRPLSWNKQALFIGLAFTEQIHRTALPLSRYDILMDCVVTDQFVLWPLNSQRGGE
ncbi:MAG: 5-formyltetrahydrofolate cyclo-ligase [Oligoflexia bacterium]|nr:5-formyltetrahydrofolate cyclo-ligase [Oligoflexia bacterium]